MLEIEITDSAGGHRVVQLPDDSVIGKGGECELRLDNWRIGKEHARVYVTPAGVFIEDMGAFSGVFVNTKRIESQAGPLKETDIIGVGPFKLKAKEMREFARVPDAGRPKVSTPAPRGADPAAAGSKVQHYVSAPAHTHTHAHAPASAPTLTVVHDAARKNLEFEWRTRLHAKLLDTMDLRRHDVSRMSDERLRAETDALIKQILADEDAQIPKELDRDALCKQVLNEAIGLGPLEELLADDSISEIMVNRHDEIYIERSGRLEKYPMSFTSDRAVAGVIERIVVPLGRRIDESSPMVDARLKDGSRVNAIIPPLALKGPTITIRKFAKRKLTDQDLVQFGSVSPAMADFMRLCVESRKNIIVSGGTGSGKTTLLNILSNFIPLGERVITVEDAAELQLHHEHLISLEARPANAEGKGSVLIRDLVRNTLRMRPDRIVVGECRGAEALDMLQAMNTGHEGSLTTLHANTPRDALARLETMVLMAGMDLPLIAIREQIASAVDVIVQQSRTSDGRRLVTHIVEVNGLESGKIQMQELFRFVQKGVDGNGRVQGVFTGCDIVPTFYDELRSGGRTLDVEIFKPIVQTFFGMDDSMSEAREASV